MTATPSSDSIIERLIHHALYHHQYGEVSQAIPVDGLAYFSGLNLLKSVLDESQFRTKTLHGELNVLPEQSEVFVRPKYEASQDDINFYVLVAQVILTYRVNTKGSAGYFFSNFGGHNQMLYPKKLLQDRTATLVIPFDLISVIKKELMPIDVRQAVIENPLHPSFSHHLAPSPAASLAIDHDLQQQMAFIVHPNMMVSAFNITEDHVKEAVKFDTKAAFDLIHSRYGIAINKDAVNEIAEMERKIVSIDGTAVVSIERDF